MPAFVLRDGNDRLQRRRRRTIFEKKKVHGLWRELVRAPDARLSGHADRTSLLPLPHAAVVPGARFSETYYWDS